MTSKDSWSNEQVHAFLLETRIPVRVACNGSSGHPLLASLWFVPQDGMLWCATQRGARIVSLLTGDPRCAFEVSVEAPPYRGVRGTGVATLREDRGEEILRILIERYLGGTDCKLASILLDRADQEIAIGIEPHTLVTWDYTERMSESV